MTELDRLASAQGEIDMKAEAELDIAKLKGALEKATRGPWRIDRGRMNDSLNITAQDREGYRLRGERNRDSDGPICYVRTENLHFDHDKDRFGNSRGESRSWKTPIHKAQADAELIVAAVNALPELIRRAGLDIDEAAWLIEWPSDKYGPIRYWATGEPQPVISADHATRFARREDAEAHAEKLSGAKAAEHMWLVPKKRRKVP